MIEERRIEEETQRRILHHNPDPQTSPPERQPLGEMAPGGMIRLGSPLGERWGFVAKRFSGYLWRHGNVVTIPWIVSHCNIEHDFCQLIKLILADGYTVQILANSTWRDVCKRLGFVEKNIPFARFGGVWVWEKEPE